jgi:ribosomal protein S26
MTREQYLEKKEELKQLALNLKSNKKQYRLEASIYSKSSSIEKNIWWKTPHIYISSLIQMRNSFRANHIFMSLIRGRTRSQIENNFDKQIWNNCTCLYVEYEIKKLCDKYEYEVNLDEHLRVIEIKEILKEEKHVKEMKKASSNNADNKEIIKCQYFFGDMVQQEELEKDINKFLEKNDISTKNVINITTEPTLGYVWVWYRTDLKKS